MKQSWAWASRLGISWILNLSKLFFSFQRGGGCSSCSLKDLVWFSLSSVKLSLNRNGWGEEQEEKNPAWIHPQRNVLWDALTKSTLQSAQALPVAAKLSFNDPVLQQIHLQVQVHPSEQPCPPELCPITPQRSTGRWLLTNPDSHACKKTRICHFNQKAAGNSIPTSWIISSLCWFQSETTPILFPWDTYPNIPDSLVFMMYRNISKVWNMLFLPWSHRKRDKDLEIKTIQNLRIWLYLRGDITQQGLRFGVLQ